MTALDWRRNATGPLKPCITCGQLAITRNADDKPQHKVCAERALAMAAAHHGNEDHEC
jgi:hypothetical protein